MEAKQIFSELDKNMNELHIAERDISMIEVGIYQKKVEQLKQDILNSLKTHLEGQARVYNQALGKYEERIGNILKKAEHQMMRLIKRYDNIYIRVCENMQFARNNQKIAIANMVTLKAQILNEEKNSETVKKLEKTLKSCAQKKVNYAVIIVECEARLEWCIQNLESDIKGLFVTTYNRMTVYRGKFLANLRNSFLNMIFGKNKYDRMLRSYEADVLKDIRLRIDQKAIDLDLMLVGILEQMRQVKMQINEMYEKMLRS